MGILLFALIPFAAVAFNAMVTGKWPLHPENQKGRRRL